MEKCMRFKVLFFGCLLAINYLSVSKDKWVVITTINYPTEALRKITALDDWDLVVVADKKTPLDWNLEHCHFLSVERQQSLGYKIVDLLPWNHYVRKNIGYLYAIEHGAKVIYDTDDDNYIQQCIEHFSQDAYFDLASDRALCVNPYPYFGQQTVWPRGFPLEKISMPKKKPYRNRLGTTSAYIQQGLVDKDPDVDAIFRLTRQEEVYFTDAPPLCLHEGSFAPFNSQNTIIHYPAFWGLLLPVLTTFRVCDIWRGYITQRLLWELGGHLCFFKSNVVQLRNDHNLLHDFKDEIDLYTKAGQLLDCLNQWDAEGDLYQKYRCLVEHLVKKGLYHPKELIVLDAWIDDLKKVGYLVPATKN